MLQAPDRVTMRTCIGCGARNLDRNCTGACDDRRLELVPAADHEHALRRLARARSRVAALRGVAETLAGSSPEHVESAFRELQAAAREALRSEALLPDEAPPERIVTWWCATCGRIEAPQDCIGVCVRRPEELVGAALDDDARELAAAAERSARRLAQLASVVASVRPRDGQWEANWRAMRSRARAVLAATPERLSRSGGGTA